MVAAQVQQQKAKEARFSADYVRSLFNYDPLTGKLTWCVTRGGQFPGSKAGKVTRRGYISVRIDRCEFRAHRLIWLIQTGSWPEELIDHIDRDPSNNKWANLRSCNTSQNMLNSKRSKVGVSGALDR